MEGAKSLRGWAVDGMTGLAYAVVRARSVESELHASFNGGGQSHVGEDLTFTLTGLRGALVPDAMVPGAAIRSVVIAGRDITATGLSLEALRAGATVVGVAAGETATLRLTTRKEPAVLSRSPPAAGRARPSTPARSSRGSSGRTRTCPCARR